MEWTLPLSVLDIGGPSFPSSLKRTPILSDRLDSMKTQHDWHKRDRPGLNRRAPLLIFLETTHKQTSNQSGFKPFQFLFVIMRSLCPGSGRQRFESSTGHQVPVLLLQEVLKLALRSLEMFRWETVNVDGDVVDNFHQCMTACSWEAALTRLCVGWEGAVTVALSSLGSVPHAWLCVLAAIGCFISWIILLFFHSHPLGILCDHTHTHTHRMWICLTTKWNASTSNAQSHLTILYLWPIPGQRNNWFPQPLFAWIDPSTGLVIPLAWCRSALCPGHVETGHTGR